MPPTPPQLPAPRRPPDVLGELTGLLGMIADVKGGATATVDFARRRLGATRAVLVRHDHPRQVLLATSTASDAELYLTSLDASPWQATRPSVLISDTHDDREFPTFSRHLAAHGIRSFRTVTLPPMRRRHVSLDLFSPDVDGFTTCPDHIGVVLDSVGMMMRAVDRAENLARALETRGLIAQAQGLLMERYGLTEVQAMSTMRRYSQDSNVKLHDIAARLVGRRALELSDGEVDP